MDELRWILLGLGVLIVIGVYGFTHWQSWRNEGFPWQRRQRQRTEREPFADDAPALDGSDPLFNESADDIVGSVRVTPVEPVVTAPEGDAAPTPTPTPTPAPAPSHAPETASESTTRTEPASSAPSEAQVVAGDADNRPIPPFLRRRDAKKPAGKTRATAKRAKPPRAEPSVSEETPADVEEQALQPALDLGEPAVEQGAVIDDQGEEKIVALSVMAPTGRPWQGSSLAEALAGMKLKLDDQGVFRRSRGRGKAATSLYTVANIIEPGTFDAAALEELSTPGVVFILQLPGSFDAQATFEEMLSDARKLAEQLDGQLLDGRRCDLTQQALEHMREELREYRRRAHLAGRRSD